MPPKTGKTNAESMSVLCYLTLNPLTLFTHPADLNRGGDGGYLKPHLIQVYSLKFGTTHTPLGISPPQVWFGTFLSPCFPSFPLGPVLLDGHREKSLASKKALGPPGISRALYLFLNKNYLFGPER